MGYAIIGPLLFYKSDLPYYWARRGPVVIGVENGRRFRRVFWRFFVSTRLAIS